MRIRFFSLFLFVVLFCLAGASAQKNHTTNWKSGSSPNAFDTIEQRADDSTKGPSAADLAAMRQQRQAKVGELNRELQDIIRAANELQDRLKATDANNVISVDLRNQGKRLEDSARKIRKQIGEL